MNPADFDFVATTLKKRSGLALGKDKTYLIESRLGPVARKHGMEDMAKLILTLRTHPTEACGLK